MLPESHKKYTDKYFIRSNMVLIAKGLNPWVKYQFFFRKPGVFKGTEEILAIIDKYSSLRYNGGIVKAIPEGSEFNSCETIMTLEGPAQDLMELETMILGVMSSEASGFKNPSKEDLDKITQKIRDIKGLIGNRPLMYMGARHYHWSDDEAISRAVLDGGADACSTDIGAETHGLTAIGTVPHALEAIFAYKYGRDNAVIGAISAFDEVIDKSVPRVSLVDFSNQEIEDSIASANALEGRLHAVRLDTCGENVQQGGYEIIPIGSVLDACRDLSYVCGTGVTISGTYDLRRALDEKEFNDVQILLSSGFGKIDKVKSFVEAEKILGMKLFDSLGVGGVVGSMFATGDIVEVGDDKDHTIPMAKVGRQYVHNDRLKIILGEK